VLEQKHIQHLQAVEHGIVIGSKSAAVPYLKLIHRRCKQRGLNIRRDLVHVRYGETGSMILTLTEPPL
jgi:hypothetical protein